MTHSWDPHTASAIAQWLNGNYDEETKQAVIYLIEHSPQEAIDAFYTPLSFGTGGMRGLMGVGTNRINVYTIRAATQALATYLCREKPQRQSAFIGFDSRNHSQTFAEEAAKVLAGNGFHVFLCKEFRPTPLISFGCRFKKCTTAIMITASHNPPEYNGYKVYWNDGGQILPQHSLEIMQELEKINDLNMIKSVSDINHSLINIVSDEIDDIYINESLKLQNYPEDNKKYGKNLSIVYTSLHGTGITLVPKLLSNWGFTDISFVEKQIIPDGNFPTVKFPNPENSSALTMGLEKLRHVNGDLLIATDPDGDRVGVAVMHQGETINLSGNQIACLCLEHICASLTAQQRMPAGSAFIKTIVTTELFQAICDHYKVECFNVPTGFKYVSELISKWETNPNAPQFIFAAEESCGYLYGTLTYDKDAIIPSALIAEIALQAKLQSKTLVDRLNELHQKYGLYVEDVICLNFEETKTGKENIAKKMAGLRSHLPKELNGIAIISIEDYLTGLKTNMQTGQTEKINQHQSDALLFSLADGSKIVIRPSGTEPKIKLHCEVVGSFLDSIQACRKETEQLITDLKSKLK